MKVNLQIRDSLGPRLWYVGKVVFPVHVEVALDAGCALRTVGASSIYRKLGGRLYRDGQAFAKVGEWKDPKIVVVTPPGSDD